MNTLDQFRSVVADVKLPTLHRLRKTAALERALAGAWWFIENVSQDDPLRNEIFFELRTIVRETRAQT